MKMFYVYPRYDIDPVRGLGSWIWDQEGQKYLDFYGGHAVISIGHSHPHYIDRVQYQLRQLGFYSNLVQMPIQDELSQKLDAENNFKIKNDSKRKPLFLFYRNNLRHNRALNFQY